jgi:hypothetical protein
MSFELRVVGSWGKTVEYPEIMLLKTGGPLKFAKSIMINGMGTDERIIGMLS